MKNVFHVSWKAPETLFHEMLWEKSFTVYPSLKAKHFVQWNTFSKEAASSVISFIVLIA